MMKDGKKNVLFVVCTHGNEVIGKKMVDKLSKNTRLINSFDYIIGNPRALKEQKRFIDFDLNRAAPGKKYSKKYELRRAYNLITLFRKYKYIIDIHQTFSTDKFLIILPKLTIKALQLAMTLPVRDILFWPPLKNSKNNPLVSYAPYGIEIECGTKMDTIASLNKLVKIISNFLDKKEKIVSKKILADKIANKRFYHVYEKIKVISGKTKRPYDFKKITVGKESFFVLPFGKYKGLFGYKMRIIDKNWIFANIEI